MKRDIFNNNIHPSEKSTAISGFIVFGIIMLICATTLGHVAYVGTGLKNYERLIMAFCSVISFLFGIAYPIISIKLIRIYPKYKKITHLFVNEKCFKDN